MRELLLLLLLLLRWHAAAGGARAGAGVGAAAPACEAEKDEGMEGRTAHVRVHPSVSSKGTNILCLAKALKCNPPVSSKGTKMPQATGVGAAAAAAAAEAQDMHARAISAHNGMGTHAAQATNQSEQLPAPVLQ